MAANLDRLITAPPPSKQLCFRISSGIATQETPDEKALLGNKTLLSFNLIDIINLMTGFAQLSIVD